MPTICTLQDHGLETGLDMQLIPRCAPALPFGNAKPVPVYIEERAINTQRAIGTTLSHEVSSPPTLPNRSSPQVPLMVRCFCSLEFARWAGNLCSGIRLFVSALSPERCCPKGF